MLKKRSIVLSGIIILLYNGDSVNGVTSPVLVVLGDPPAVLLVLLSVLILFKFEEGVEISMDSPAQFIIAAVEAPSTLNALCVAKRVSLSSELWRGGVRFSVAPFTLSVLRTVERVSPSGEFMRGCLRFPFSVERVLSGSAGDGEELALARVFFTVLVGEDFLPSLASPEEPGVRWALDRVVMVAVARLLSFKENSFSFFACLAERHRSHGAFFFCSRILCDVAIYSQSNG